MKYYTVPMKAMEGHEMYRHAEAPTERDALCRLIGVLDRESPSINSKFPSVACN